MTIEITATKQIEIKDLGIILAENEFINLLDNFYKEDLLSSSSLKTAIDDSAITMSIDSEIVNYEEFVNKLSSFTKHEHNTLNKIQHNLYKDNFFQVTKTDGTTKYITYYTDDTLSDKIQEDEIIRDTNNRVSQIITKKYEDGVVVQELTQNLNRVEGKVDSITTNTQ